MPKDDSKKEFKDSLKDYAPYIGLGLQLAVTIGIMVYIGYILDKHFNTEPILIIVCSAIGIFAALYNFIKTVMKSEK